LAACGIAIARATDRAPRRAREEPRRLGAVTTPVDACGTSSQQIVTAIDSITHAGRGSTRANTTDANAVFA
jgi:hypothetical protein